MCHGRRHAVTDPLPGRDLKTAMVLEAVRDDMSKARIWKHVALPPAAAVLLLLVTVTGTGQAWLPAAAGRSTVSDEAVQSARNTGGFAAAAPLAHPTAHALHTGPIAQPGLRGLAAVAAGEASTGNYGAPLIAGCAWATWVANCQNLTVYGNGNSFNDSGCGPPFGCTFGPEFQCTQLAQRYAYYAWGEPANWYGYGGAGGNADDMWVSGPALPVPLQRFANGAGIAPRQGDLMIFGPGWLGSYWDGAGHVAVVTTVGTNYVDVAEENATPTGSDVFALNGSTVSARGYTPIIGWLRNSGAQLTTASLAGAPQAVSPSAGVVDVFWRGRDNRLAELSYTGGRISQPWFNNNPANMASDPSVASPASGQVSIFWEGADGYLWGEPSAGGVAADLGDGPLASPPQAVSTGNGAVDTFWLGTGGNIWTDTFTARTHSGQQQIGGGPGASQPRAVSFGAGDVAVFWRGSDQSLWFSQNTGSGWSSPVSAGFAPMASGPSVASPSAGAIEVTWLGQSLSVVAATYTGGTWSGAATVTSTKMASPPTLVPSAPGVLTAFLRGAGGQLYMTTLVTTSGWEGLTALCAGPLGSVPSAAPDGAAGGFAVFWHGQNGGLWYTTT
jgi:hypothetical protein